MLQINSVAPQFSANRNGGERVEIQGAGLDAATSVAFGRFDATIVEKSESRLVVTAPDYRPGHGGHHGEVIVWVDTEPTRTGVMWTWEGKTLEQLGTDPVDAHVALESAPAPVGDPNDPVDQALAAPAATEPAQSAPAHAVVSSYEPTTVPRAGGWITIHGRGFTGATKVTVGSAPCKEFQVRSGSVVAALAPYAPTNMDHEYPPTPLVWLGETPSLVDSSVPLMQWEVAEGMTTRPAYGPETEGQPE